MDIITNQTEAKENILSRFRNFLPTSHDKELIKDSEANTFSYRIPQNLNTPQTFVEYLSEKLHRNSRSCRSGNVHLQPSISLHKKSEICGVLNKSQRMRVSGKHRLGDSRIIPLPSFQQSFCEDTYSGYAKKKLPTVNKHLQRNIIIRKPHEQRYALKNGTYNSPWLKSNTKRVSLRPRAHSSSNSDVSVDTHMSSTDELFKVGKRQRAPGRYIVGRHFHNLCNDLKTRTTPYRISLSPVTKKRLRLADRGLDTIDYKSNERVNFIPKLRLTSQRSVGKLSEEERNGGHTGHSPLSRWLSEYKPKKVIRHERHTESEASTREGSTSATTNEEYSCSSSMSSSKPLRTALRNSTRRKRPSRKRCVTFDPRIGKHTPASKHKRYERLKQAEYNSPSSCDSDLQPRACLKKRNSVLKNAFKKWGLSSSSETIPPVYTSGEGSTEDMPTSMSYRRLQSDDESMK